MQKLLLISILIVTVALPMRAARDPNPGRALRHVVYGIAAYVAFYVIAIVYIMPRLP
jgi:hypothetical protein